MSNKHNLTLAKKNQLPRSCVRVQTADHGVTMTRQSHAAECDINNIMQRAQKDGVVTHFNKHGAHYGDILHSDFTEAMQTVAKANSMFEELPSSARTRFNNDPAQFLQFVQDEKNHEEMVTLGLAKGTLENPSNQSLVNPSDPGTVNDPVPAPAVSSSESPPTE